MRFSELDGRTIAVWGLGRETRAFARQAAARLPAARLAVVVREDEREDVSDACWEGASVVGAARAVKAVSRCDVLVRSPGVSVHKPALRELARRGVAITTSTGLWLAQRGGARVIGVTGTKGKSTTATVIGHLLQARVAGNIGSPAIDLLDAPDGDWVVLELSSFQIADLEHGPQVAVITNLHREHLDWHGSEQAYRAEKLRIFALPGVEVAVHPVGNAEIEGAVAGVAQRVAFGGPGGWRVADDALHGPGGDEIPLGALPLRGAHNAQNLCAALSALSAVGLPPAPLPGALAGLRPLRHRLETVHDAGGVEWIDDSISTTPESSIAALETFPDRPIVLVAGGSDRGQDYSRLAREAVARDVALITLPRTGARLADEAQRAGLDPGRMVAAADMVQAVAAARRLAVPGSVVLLSPGAPSFDSYRNFEERGDHYAALARR